MFLLVRYTYIVSLLYGLLFLSNASLLCAQNLGFYFEKDQKRLSIPFELHNNLVIIPITVNEKYTLNFILDTGVRSTILVNKELADSIGIVYQRSIQLYGVGNEAPVNALVTDHLSLEIPGIKNNGLSGLVLEKDFLHLDRHLGMRIHGLIGYDIFGRFVVKIDYLRKRITFFEPLDFKVNRNYFPIELEMLESKPIAKLNLQLIGNNEIETRLLVDTGASHALVLNEKSDKRIKLPERRIQANLGRGLEGEINGHLARINTLDFGKKSLKGVIASFPEKSNFENTDFNMRNGSIGGELLKKFTCVFDFVNSKLYVKANRSFKYPFEYNMSGLEFIAEGKSLNQFVISKIRKNSAVYGIGFEPGDIIVSLNNLPSKKLDLNKIYTNLNLREGKKIYLTVYRNGKYISRSFRLKREI